VKRFKQKEIYLVTLLLLSQFLFAQTYEIEKSYLDLFTNSEPNLLLPSDSIALANLPELKCPVNLFRSELPASLDNSDQPYFRPLFAQISAECGQFAGIAFNFTYEMDYRRNVPADVPENQFPTFYSYNFQNGGYGWHGVSYFHSFEIARTNGQPTVADYGGITEGGPQRWLSGYDEYYHGMFNKLDKVYQIRVGTPEGLLTLKHWLFDHLNDEAVGGIACFYAATAWNTTILPAGTPEGGKHVETAFPGRATHACTITGWNDSIRFDYNNDGQYTNNIDINSDSVVDMKDWEIGGLLFFDTYIGGLTWADSSYCYMMYKTLADEIPTGGIWNHAVHVLKVKEDYAPLLTMKVVLNHNSRDKIKVLAGISANPESNEPENILGFPIFDFQGGNQYMQGGNSITENKTIEFGLDITPLLGGIQSGQDAKVYLQVIEKDTSNVGTGSIMNFSVIDYTSGNKEYPCQQTNIPLAENGITTAGILVNIDFNNLNLANEELPLSLVNEPYSCQLNASGGTPPYSWNLYRPYTETDLTGIFPEVNDTKLNLSDTIGGIAAVPLDFSFPFYGKSYDTLYIHNEGFIMFDDQNYPWPYLFENQLMIKKARLIAPLLSKELVLDTLAGDGIWFEGDENHSSFRWRCTSISPVIQDINFAVTLYSTGEIKFYYDKASNYSNLYASCGISAGDEMNYVLSQIINDSINFCTSIRYFPEEFPEELSLSESGLLYGTPQNYYNGVNIGIAVTDYNNLIVRKVLPFYSWYAGINDVKNPSEELFKVFPNPVKGTVTTELELTKPSSVLLSLYDNNGKLISLKNAGMFAPGIHCLTWDLNERGNNLPQGNYYLLVNTEHWQQVRKLILIYDK
jgi:hypothetical protein